MNTPTPRTDTEMLNWLDQQGAHYGWKVQLPTDYPNVQDCVFVCRNTTSGHKTIRAAILAAMKQGSPQLIAERTDAIYQRACEVEHELRAEVEKLKRAYEYDHKCLYEVRDRCELWKQRAEKAEAQLATEGAK